MSVDQKKSIFEFAHWFKEVEVRHKLFELKTADGIYYWDLFRYHVYYTMLSENGIYENVQGILHKSKESIVRRLLKAVRLFPLLLLNELRFLLLEKNRKFAFLLISRFQDKKGNPTDLLMNDIYSQLFKDSFTFELFRHPSFGWLKGNISKRYFLYKLELSYLLGKSRSYDWTHLAHLINSEFGLNIAWHNTFDELINRYRKEYNFFNGVFKKITPKFLFFQTSPKGMIAAANVLGIKTVDIQHGHTNNVGVLYSYPREVNVKHVPSIPNVFLTLGKFWNSLIDFPFKIQTVGNNYFYIEPDENIQVRKGIMVVSVLFTHDFLQETTAKLAKEHPEFIFYYKLHSNQKHQEKDCRIFFKSFQNVQVIYTEESVKDIMVRCFAVIVIQTSVTYQALQKGLIVFIIKKDYYEVSYDVFNEDGVNLVNDWEELSAELSSVKFQREKSTTLFFEPYEPATIEKLIS